MDLEMESDCHRDGCPCCDVTESESDDEVPPPATKKPRAQSEVPVSTLLGGSTSTKEEPELEFDSYNGGVIALPWYDPPSYYVTGGSAIRNMATMGTKTSGIKEMGRPVKIKDPWRCLT